MSLFPRLLGTASVAVAFAAVASPAQADPTVTFPVGQTPVTTVTITDPGPSSPTVHLVVTAADPAQIEDTHVFIGGDNDIPYSAIGVDGVHDARYAENFDGDDLSTADCLIYDGSEVVPDTPVTVSGDSYSADLPKGEVISFEEVGVATGIVGSDAPCTNGVYHGVAVDYFDTKDDIDGISWDAPAAPVVTATGGRRQVALSFPQERGTEYEIYRAGSDVPFTGTVRGMGDDEQVVLTEDGDGNPLMPGTAYAFQVKATRMFNVWNDARDDMFEPTSPLSAPATATTAPVQVVTFTAAPEASTTATSASFAWTISGNDAGEAPFCLLDLTEMSGTEVPCTTTGASLTGLAVGAHKLTVFPADNEEAYTREWTVTAPAAAPAGPATPATPATPAVPATPSKIDPDGDGIKNTWLINGKAAPAPAAPKASAAGGAVKLALGKAGKQAKKVRVYRATGKGKFTLVATVKPKAKSFTDKKVKPGKTYRYKTVAVNAKGQQGAASKQAVAKVRKAKKGRKK
jgi:hypothetical protein